MEEVKLRYTKLENGNWIIEATSQLPISLIRSTMRFIDDTGTEHDVTQLLTPEGSAEAPYHYFVEAVVKD